MSKKNTKEDIGRYSKRKGTRAELEAAKILGKFFLDDSESFARFGNEVAGRIPGDVGIYIKEDMRTTIKLWEIFPLSFEIKNREDWKLDSLLSNSTKNVILDFWEQACKEGKRFGKQAFLILKKNFYPYFGVFTETALFQFPKNILLISTPQNEQIKIFKLEDFINVNQNNQFISELKKTYKELKNNAEKLN